MAAFPAIEPYRRAYDLARSPMEEQSAWPGVSIRYATGLTGTEQTGAVLRLSYINLSDAQIQQLRSHYTGQLGGVIDFTLPPIIWQGSGSMLANPAIEWHYAGAPQEAQRKGGLFNVTVTLESGLFSAPTP
jgi:hypothetical protein